MTRSFDASHIDSFASGAWPLWSWVSDDTRELCPRFDLTLGEFSCCQFLVGEMLSNYRNYERIQPLQGVTAHVADVQAERELIHVAVQVLLGNLMVDAVHSALEHSPDGFNAVRADSVLGVDASRVVDGYRDERTDRQGRRTQSLRRVKIVEPTSTLAWTADCRAAMSVASIGIATVRPPRSRMPYDGGLADRSHVQP